MRVLSNIPPFFVKVNLDSVSFLFISLLINSRFCKKLYIWRIVPVSNKLEGTGYGAVDRRRRGRHRGRPRSSEHQATDSDEEDGGTLRRSPRLRAKQLMQSSYSLRTSARRMSKRRSFEAAAPESQASACKRGRRCYRQSRI